MVALICFIPGKRFVNKSLAENNDAFKLCCSPTPLFMKSMPAFYSFFNLKGHIESSALFPALPLFLSFPLVAVF